MFLHFLRENIEHSPIERARWAIVLEDLNHTLLDIWILHHIVFKLLAIDSNYFAILSFPLLCLVVHVFLAVEPSLDEVLRLFTE